VGEIRRNHPAQNALAVFESHAKSEVRYHKQQAQSQSTCLFREQPQHCVSISIVSVANKSALLAPAPSFSLWLSPPPTSLSVSLALSLALLQLFSTPLFPYPSACHHVEHLGHPVVEQQRPSLASRTAAGRGASPSSKELASAAANCQRLVAHVSDTTSRH
jgi:hypothetical protein